MEEIKKVRRGLLHPKKPYERYKAELQAILKGIEMLPEEDRDAQIKELAEKDLFFFSIFILGLTYVDNPFGYRLCYNVQHQKYQCMWIIAREHYKDLACDTPVLTTEGWKTHGELKVGDVVYTPYGTSPVIATRHFTDSHCRKVNMVGGESIVCGNGHLWKVNKYTRSKKIHDFDSSERGTWYETVCETSEIMGNFSGKHPYIKPTGYTIDDDIELPIPPYTLGAWLGDGNSRDGRITNVDEEVFENIAEDGFEIAPKNGKNYPQTIYGLHAKLKACDLIMNKHIPSIYFNASDRQRLALLQGLMDTDGNMPTNSRNGANITQKRYGLSRDVLALVNSLGYKGKMNTITHSNGYVCYNVAFPLKKGDLCPFRLPRKIANISDKPHQTTGERWYIKSIEEHETVPTNCIQIEDPRGMYLAGEGLVPTHNSTIITKASTMWEIVKNPEVTICIYSYNTDISKEFLGVIKTWCETNLVLKRIWKDVLWENPAQGYEMNGNLKTTWTWRTDAIEVKRKSLGRQEKTLEAGGLIGGQKTGYHFEKLIYDDSETLKTVDTIDSIQKIISAYNMSANTGQTDNMNQCVVGTIYAMDDLYCTLESQGDIQPIIQSCFEDNNVPEEEKIPIRFTMDQLRDKRKKMDAFTWATQMLCDPRLGNNRGFDEEWWQTWDADNLDNLNIYIVVDPAGTVSNRGDYTSMWVFGIDEFENIMFITLVYDKLNLESKCDTLIELVREYRPLCVWYEKVGMQSDIEYIKSRQKQLNRRFQIQPMEAKGSKESRIDVLASMMSNHRVYMPKQCIRKNWQNKWIDMLKLFHDTEFVNFPMVKHDDGLDSASMAPRLLLDGRLKAPRGNASSSRKSSTNNNNDCYDPMKFAIDSK